MCFLVESVRMSNLSSIIEEQKQTSQVTHDRMVVENMFSANGDDPLNSSRSTRNTSGTSCWVLKLKDASLVEETFRCNARKKSDGSIGTDKRFNKDMLSMTALTSGD